MHNYCFGLYYRVGLLKGCRRYELCFTKELSHTEIISVVSALLTFKNTTLRRVCVCVRARVLEHIACVRFAILLLLLPALRDPSVEIMVWSSFW